MRIIPADLLLLLLVLYTPSTMSAADSDGPSDDFEQDPLDTFVPSFMLSPMDGNGSPAEFEQGATDLPETVLVKLDEPESPSIVSVNESQASVKTAILVTASTADALITTDLKTDAAISKSAGAVGKSVKISTGKTGSALHRAGRAVWKALRGSTKQKDGQ